MPGNPFKLNFDKSNAFRSSHKSALSRERRQHAIFLPNQCAHHSITQKHSFIPSCCEMIELQIIILLLAVQMQLQTESLQQIEIFE
jgi:hypothetical protein